ncbi:MAG: IS110 family transposase [Clostridia bacterium]|nr:IS110 family transposase [Clostridia bacterium]
MHKKMRHVYCGIDTHKKTHTAVLINCWNEKLDEVTFHNKLSDFGKLLEMVEKHTTEEISCVYGLEDVGGSGRALAEFLISKRCIVKHVQSGLSYSERRNQAIMHKDDSFDGLCVARVLLNKLDDLPDAACNDIYWTLKQLVNRRDSLVGSNITLKNNLHAQLQHHYANYQKFFYMFDCPTALEFWHKYPSPVQLRGVGVDGLADLLREHSNNLLSTKRAELILSIVEQDGFKELDYQSNRDFIVRSIVDQLKFNNKEIKKIEAEAKSILDLLGYKLETLPGMNLASASAMIAEIGDIRRFSSSAKLAKYAAAAPVSYSSGQKEKHLRNRQGNRNLNTLFYGLAVRQLIKGRNGDRPVSWVFQEYYKKKLSEGKTKKQAIACIMRRLVNIVYGMMRDKTEYRKPEVSNWDAG